MNVKISFIIIFLLASGCGSKTDFVNCVFVKNENQYTGKRLKFSGEAEKFQITSLNECVALDINYDDGDGKMKGRVRWADCWGPDCNEAGMF